MRNYQYVAECSVKVCKLVRQASVDSSDFGVYAISIHACGTQTGHMGVRGGPMVRANG